MGMWLFVLVPLIGASVVLNLYVVVAFGSVSDDDWERVFQDIPIVEQYTRLYPDYTTIHHEEFGLRTIHYEAQIPIGDIVLGVKKSMIHGGSIVVYVGCPPELDFGMNKTNYNPVDSERLIAAEMGMDAFYDAGCR